MLSKARLSYVSTCSTASSELAEPLSATAATARTWLLLEQPGPWGAKALSQSHLDAGVGIALERAAEGTGTRIALIRRPGRHADQQGAPRRVFVAHTQPGRSWVRATEVTEPQQLLEWDFAALGAGHHRNLGVPHVGDPLVLVCTNGKRDRCCAIRGRPLAAELAASGHNVWEITHIGGHRFSPTLLVLPHGYSYGRVDAPAIKSVTNALAEGRVVTEHCRGRSAWERPGQAAELAVRDLTGELDVNALAISETKALQDSWAVTVNHLDGRAWRVNVVASTEAPPVSASCGAALTRQARMEIAAVTALTP